MNTKLATVARYETNYGYHRVLDLGWEAAVERAREALGAEGFGNPQLEAIARQINDRLRRVIDSI